jgi:hypothetical protein
MRFASARKVFVGSGSVSLIESLESRRLMSVATSLQSAGESSTMGATLAAAEAPTVRFVRLQQEPFVGTEAAVRGEVEITPYDGQAYNVYRQSVVEAYLGNQLLGTTVLGGNYSQLREQQFELRVSLPQGGTHQLRIVVKPVQAPQFPAETTFTVQTMSAAQDQTRVDPKILWDRHGTFIIEAADGKPLASGWMLIRSSMTHGPVDAYPMADEFERVPVVNGVAQWEGYKTPKFAYRTYVQIHYSGDAHYRTHSVSRGHLSTFPNPVGGELAVRRGDGAPATFVFRAGQPAVIDLKMLRYVYDATGSMKLWHEGKVLASADAQHTFSFSLGVLPVGTHTIWAEMSSPHRDGGSVATYGIEPVTIIVKEAPGATVTGPRVLRAGESGQMKVTLPDLTSGRIRFRVLGQEGATDKDIAPDGAASFDLPALGSGTHTIVADLLDDGGQPITRIGQLSVTVIDGALPGVASAASNAVAYVDRAASRLRTTFRFDGETYLRDLHLPAEHWSLKGLVDVGGDGFEDLVWQNVNTGQVVVWHLNQWANVSKVTILHPGGAWQLEDVRDDNNDGTLDYVWQHRTSGKEAVWFTDAKRRITSFEIR